MDDSNTTYPEDSIKQPAADYVPLLGLSRYRDEDILTKEELARALGCSPRTLQRFVQRFEIPPAVWLGNRAVWIAGDVKKWIQEAAEKKRQAALKEAKRLDAFQG